MNFSIDKMIPVVYNITVHPTTRFNRSNEVSVEEKLEAGKPTTLGFERIKSRKGYVNMGIALDPALHARLKEYSEEENRSMNFIIEEALYEWLERND